MNFSAKQNERKCINDDSNLFCKKNHFMKNIDETFLILITSDFFEVVRHHQECVKVRCNWICPREIPCSMQVKLERLNNYVDYIRERNLHGKKIVSKIGLIYEKDIAQGKKVFWWSEIVELEEKTVPEDASIRWRSQFL